MSLRIPGINEPIEPVPSDSPTRRQAAPPSPQSAAQAVAPRPVAATASAPSRPSAKKPKSPVTLDSALGSAQRAVNSRVATDLWDLLNERAEAAGVPLRLVITDALAHALELDPSEHQARLLATRRREQLARIDAQ